MFAAMPVSIPPRSTPPRSTAARRPSNLSDREREVLRAWLLCDSKPQVARQLYLSLGTVNTHLARIRQKYEAVGRVAPSKAALCARALQDGIVVLDEL